jgi:hypothetical protein
LRTSSETMWARSSSVKPWKRIRAPWNGFTLCWKCNKIWNLNELIFLLKYNFYWLHLIGSVDEIVNKLFYSKWIQYPFSQTIKYLFI